MQLAAYTSGPTVPSTRARVRQYIRPLAESGIHVHEYPLPWGNTMPETALMRPLWMTGTFGARLCSLVAGRWADVSWVSRQLMPAFVPVQRLLSTPMVLDVDDAVWLNRGGHRAKELAMSADVIVCGNSFLAEWYRQWNSQIYIVPTAIDTTLYGRKPRWDFMRSTLYIGWTGTSLNYPFLYDIETALQHVLDRNPQAALLIVADKPPRFTTIPESRIEFVKWTPKAELDALNRMSIGIMPLADTDWCRGKCSYKMLCYMASHMPVVVSAVGMNKNVLAEGDVGFAADTTESWIAALERLIEDPHLRTAMGQRARTMVEAKYSLHVLAARYANIFRTLNLHRA
jgi:glycosyltransferase involved in cell wall biosynthesis